VKYVKSVLKDDDLMGKCDDFQVVPGCGLKANVSNINQSVNSLSQSSAIVEFDQSQHSATA